MSNSLERQSVARVDQDFVNRVENALALSRDQALEVIKSGIYTQVWSVLSVPDLARKCGFCISYLDNVALKANPEKTLSEILQSQD